jgi:CBS domain-containing protein
MKPRHAIRGAPLAVRTLRIFGPDEQTSDETVLCPRRSAAIPADECLACCDFEGIECAPDCNYLRCSHPAGPELALARLMRRPSALSAADETPLSEVMTPDVLCVLAGLGLDDLTELLVGRHISGAPVVDRVGRPIGVVTTGDLLGRSPGDSVVADIMMPLAFTLPESATLSQAAALMAIECVHRIPVVSADGRVVGLLSSLDVARWLARNDGYLAPQAGPDD